MAVDTRERWHLRAQQWIDMAIATPMGALFYILGGWPYVVAVAVSSFFLALGVLLWLAWSEARS